MGIWDFIKSSTEAVKRNVLDFTPVRVKNAFRTSYNYGSAACTKIDNVVVGNNLQKLNQWCLDDVAKSKIGIFATRCAKIFALNALYGSYRYYPVVDAMEMVWISVCCPIKYEQSVEGVWKWKYTENGKGETTPILVLETISYAELYDKVKEVLEIDTNLYKMEMSALVPIMREAPAAPIIIDRDNNVKWFVSVCMETFLCVTISKEIENHEEFGDDDVYC
ncbi:uncharacterized protein LOC111370751 [Olea europaea var. sylvestris]|uniref:uncharacterized protein LOC111370751 n=1 Tax=Olea europaea var. sylvestris TaxID=158386 RepID=UPI000C1D45DD|nr:uncharacterized protein LOC111370751 [Olea europaea var. sylvestris]